MRRPMIFSALIAAASVAVSGCVIVSGNRAEVGPGGLTATCGDRSPTGVGREQLMEATSGFERLDRINVICADSKAGRVLLKIAGEREGGGHGERTFVVRGERLEPIS
jgi:hypothetical protein